jgi:threonine synthase
VRYHSTRGLAAGEGTPLAAAIAGGLAPDGGLYVPARVPRLGIADFDGRQTPAEVAEVLLAPYFEGDVLAAALPGICDETFRFELPLVPLDGAPGAPAVLELFHGPTAAFKDVGAGFLAACLQRLEAGAERPLEILVATSGDTGGAVAAAFHRRPGIRVGILYPDGLVSPRQAHQLACWGDNVRTWKVKGSFDDCQRLVKAAFRDPEMRSRLRLSSANSINIGRLLPQMVYYATTSLAWWRRRGEVPGFVIPTGNLGNAFACLLAREMGLPIGDVILAVNANRTIPDYFESGEWRPRPSIATLASAMDVGDPSNVERLDWLYDGRDRGDLRLSARAVSDEEIRAEIAAGPARWGQVWCPHTATAVRAWSRLDEERRARPWVLVATAHPAKFETVVEPLIGRRVPVPPALAELLDLPAHAEPLEPNLGALRAALTES